MNKSGVSLPHLVLQFALLGGAGSSPGWHRPLHSNPNGSQMTPCEDYAVPGELKPASMDVDYLSIRQFALDAALQLRLHTSPDELVTAAKAIENYLVGALEDA